MLQDIATPLTRQIKELNSVVYLSDTSQASCIPSEQGNTCRSSPIRWAALPSLCCIVISRNEHGFPAGRFYCLQISLKRLRAKRGFVLKSYHCLLKALFWPCSSISDHLAKDTVQLPPEMLTTRLEADLAEEGVGRKTTLVTHNLALETSCLAISFLITSAIYTKTKTESQHSLLCDFFAPRLKPANNQ